MGVSHNAKEIDGMQEGTFNLHSSSDCFQLGDLLKRFKGDKIVICVPPSEKGQKNEEAIYEYAFAISKIVSKYKQKVKIQVIMPQPRPFSFAVREEIHIFKVNSKICTFKKKRGRMFQKLLWRE